IVRAQRVRVAFLRLVVARQGEPPLRGAGREGRYLLVALDRAVEAPVAGVELAQASLGRWIVGALLSVPQALDEGDALPHETGEGGPQLGRLMIRRDGCREVRPRGR